MTAKLSDTQLVILSAACQREDRSVFPVMAKLTGGAPNKVLTSLLGKGLLEEVATTVTEHVWRTASEGERFALRATAAACEALGIEGLADTSGSSGEAIDGAGDASASRRARKPRKATQGRTQAGEADTAGTGPAEASGGPMAPTGTARRTGTKQAELIAMLRRPEGASIDEIVAATGWQKHTVRGAIAGALKKKLGLQVTSAKVEGRGRVYRI